MGSSSSKTAKTAAGVAKRHYPQRTPQHTNAPSAPRQPPGQSTTPGPTVHPQAQASSSKDQSISLDASDPDFARSLRALGPVSPAPTHSHSAMSQQTPDQHSSRPPIFPNPASNPAVQILTARENLARMAEAEFARPGKDRVGRRFLDVITIRQVLSLRDDRGMGAGDIEKKLGLATGVVERLGGKGVVGDTTVGGL